MPVARVVLSHPLAIFALVGRYPTNKLIAREPLSRRNSFPGKKMPPRQIARYYPPVRKAIPVPGVGYPRLTAPFATSPSPPQYAAAVGTRQFSYCLLPLPTAHCGRLGFVRLACLIHAANVRSEPGSNPSKKDAFPRAYALGYQTRFPSLAR